MVVSLEAALHYYDVSGRTWERQAFVKARPIAGDLDLGQEFLDAARAVDLSPLPEPGRYHRHQGAQAAHRAAHAARRGRRAQRENRPRRHSRHRVRDSVPAAAQRRRSAGAAHRQHAGSDRRSSKQCGCLTHQERTLLEENYAFCARSSIGCRSCSICKRTCCPRDPAELRKLAIRWAMPTRPSKPALAAFEADYKQQDRAEPQDSRSPAARRLQRRHADRAGKRPGARSRAAPRADRRGAGPVSVSATFRRRTRT